MLEQPHAIHLLLQLAELLIAVLELLLLQVRLAVVCQQIQQMHLLARHHRRLLSSAVDLCGAVLGVLAQLLLVWCGLISLATILHQLLLFQLLDDVCQELLD